MKNKTIILDFGIFQFRSIFATLNNPTIPATYTCLAAIIGCLKKIGVTKSDNIIIACDKGSWRKDFSKEYKADRAEKRKKSPIDWQSEFEKMNQLLQTLDLSTIFHVIKLPKIEADDIASVCCRVFKDSEIVLVSYDEDWQLLWNYPNVKIFSPMTKRYKLKLANFNVYKLLASKIRKETSDNLVSPILNKKQYENRMKIVNLLELPEWVEQSIIAELESLENKEENLDLIPFKSLRSRFETLYNQDKIVTYEKCVKYEERRANKLKKNKLIKKAKPKKDNFKEIIDEVFK